MCDTTNYLIDCALVFSFNYMEKRRVPEEFMYDFGYAVELEKVVKWIADLALHQNSW